MSELREKVIAEIEAHENNYHQHLKYGSDCNTPEETTDSILSLIPSTKDIQWVGECPDCKGYSFPYDTYGGRTTCIPCNGTGQIVRPATFEEVVEVANNTLTALELFAGTGGKKERDAANAALTINGGTLRRKED
jgi:hypothetical protein